MAWACMAVNRTGTLAFVDDFTKRVTVDVYNSTVCPAAKNSLDNNFKHTARRVPHGEGMEYPPLAE